MLKQEKGQERKPADYRRAGAPQGERDLLLQGGQQVKIGRLGGKV